VRKPTVPNGTTASPSLAKGKERALLDLMLADQSYWQQARLVPND
jgi:hypothetical protein